MRSRRLTSCVLLIALGASARAQAPAAPPEPQGPTIAQAEEQVRVIRAALKDRNVARPESWGVLMMSELVLLNLRAQKAAGGAPVDPASLQDEQRKIRERVFAEWKAAWPDDATPYIAEMQGKVAPEKMDDAVLGLLPRFPDDPRLLGRATQILSKREQSKAATDLVEAALERHPERSDLYGVAMSLYRTLDNEARQRELATAWIDRLPGDANALGVYLLLPPSSRDPRESAARVERFVAAGGADAARVERCGWLLTTDQGAYRDAAVRCLNLASEQTRDAQIRARAAGFLAGASAAEGNAGELEHSLAALPRERRLEAILNAVHTLGEGRCARKVSLLNLLPWDGSEAAGTPSNRLGALHGCETFPAARAMFLDALARGPAGDLRNLLYRWFTKVNGHYLENGDFGLAPRVVATLEERKQREASQVEVWQALDEAYQLATWDDRRAAHLAAWTSSSLAPPPAEALTWLADYRSEHDGAQAGVDTLRLAWKKSHDVAIASALAEQLLAAGRLDDFGALVDELAAGTSGETADSQATNLALLLRARGALLHKDPEGALTHYAAYVDRAPYLKREEAAEYVLVLGAVRGAPAAEQAAEALCAKPSLQNTGETPSQCAASLLSQLGHSKGALQLLEAAAQRAPEDLRLQFSFATAAEQAGAFDRAEQAYRRLLTIDPKSETYWAGLGRMAERRDDPGEMETILRQAEKARGDQPPGLVLALARVYLTHHRPERAIEILTALRQRSPNNPYVGEEEIRQAYRDLSAATPRNLSFFHRRSVGNRGTIALAAFHLLAPAGKSAAPPSPDDLRAMREAEAALLGIGGPMDEPKGRAIVARLAPQGNVYANIRLSIWQQAGTQGYTRNPAQAAATAQPYLASLRAAAMAGEPYAEYLWGTVLLRGIAVPKQAEEGGAWLRKAAERGEPWALHNIGWMAENGDGAPLDLKEAVVWYRRGAEAGNVHSMMSLAWLRMASKPELHQSAEGVKWLAKAAEKGLPEAVSWFGPLLFYGLAEIPADPVRARPWLEKGAAAGDLRATADLGVALVSGLGGPAEEKRGVALLQQTAEKGNGVAMWQLVWQLALGQGAPRDAVRAEQWIERAAFARNDELGTILGAAEESTEAARRYFARGLATLEQMAAKGDAFAGGFVSRFYQMGSGVTRNPARAVAFARPAAAAGSTEAMRVLGWAYRLGEGVEMNANQAAAWWRKGAEGGNSYCMMWYSKMLFKGEAGKQDSAAGYTWLERAGEKGNSWSIVDLGNFYDAGAYGVPRDEKKAAYWKRKALGFGNEEARGWLIAHHMLE